MRTLVEIMQDQAEAMYPLIEQMLQENDYEPEEPEPHCARCGECADEGDTECFYCGGRISHG